MDPPGALTGEGRGDRGGAAQARHAAVELPRLTDATVRGGRGASESMPAAEALEAPVVPAGLGRGDGGAELRGAGGQGCRLPPGMGDVAPHLWMPTALRLLELLGDLQEGCCGGLNERAYGAWELYPWAVRSVLRNAQPPPRPGSSTSWLTLMSW